MGKKRLVFGVGVNDADYPVNPRVAGKIKACPYYTAWTSMLRRAYSAVYQVNQPTYVDVEVSSDWLTFSNFKSWMEQQDWEGKSLDKDLLLKGNKLYGPEFCMFVPQSVNSFMTERGSLRGEWPIGVHFRKQSGRFQAECRNLKGSKKHLGMFDCPQEAHRAWLTEKLRQAKILASEQSDPRISAALIRRYEEYHEKDN